MTEPAWLTVAESHLHLACKKLQHSGLFADGQDAFPTWEEGCRSGRCGNALPWRHSSLLRPLARVGRHTAWTSCAPCAQSSGSSDFRIKTTTHKTARISIKHHRGGLHLFKARSAPGYWRTCLASYMLCVDGCLASLGSLGARVLEDLPGILDALRRRVPRSPRFARLARPTGVSAPASLRSARSAPGMGASLASLRSARSAPGGFGSRLAWLGFARHAMLWGQRAGKTLSL